MLLTGTVCLAQEKMTEKQVMKESHIDFSRQYIYFTLHGLIEIDGHIFKNDTCKCPIIYQATLDGITIIDTCIKVEYVHRKCNVKDCNIIHLTKDEPILIRDPYRYFQVPDHIDLNTHEIGYDTIVWINPALDMFKASILEHGINAVITKRN